MTIDIADDYQTERRRSKINAIIDCFYADDDEECLAADCLITDESCLSDWGLGAEDVAKIQAKFPKFEAHMDGTYLWQLADIL